MKNKQQLWMSFVILLVGVFTSSFVRISSILWSDIIFMISFVLFAVTLILAFVYKEKPDGNGKGDK